MAGVSRYAGSPLCSSPSLWASSQSVLCPCQLSGARNGGRSAARAPGGPAAGDCQRSGDQLASQVERLGHAPQLVVEVARGRCSPV
eukprot:7977870-Pyramimonas_sp.AAC.1